MHQLNRFSECLPSFKKSGKKTLQIELQNLYEIDLLDENFKSKSLKDWKNILAIKLKFHFIENRVNFTLIYLSIYL